ncbi:MAG: hypothetical protein Q4E67_08425 [Planctomycetia bacterium]|nr:hypothetical protein [Planctomycetia bacterium]
MFHNSLDCFYTSLVGSQCQSLLHVFVNRVTIGTYERIDLPFTIEKPE